MTTVTKTNNLVKPGIYNNILDKFYRNNFNEWWNENQMETVPAVNIKENKDNFSIEMAVPGMKKDDFKVQVDGDLITISSESETETKEEAKNYSKREYNYSSFSRSFTLPDSANTDKINANYADGVLKLSIAKKEEAAKAIAKKITVS